MLFLAEGNPWPLDEELFNDGWREPGDDCRRLEYYVLAFLALPLFAGFIGFGLWLLLKPACACNDAFRIGFGAFAALFGLLMLAGDVAFFVKEAARWDLRHLTADRVVAGMFLFGFALLLAGFEMGRGYGHADGKLLGSGIFLLAGAAVLVLSLFVGLACAFWPRLAVRTKTVQVASVETRYALDRALMEHEEHPCPSVDGWTPCVRLRTETGRSLTLRCNDAAYRLAKPGSPGVARVRGEVLEEFHPISHRVYRA